jgi:hypothetical membrane protein
MNARVLLKAGVAMPVIYIATVVVSALLFPGFALLERMPSDLGGPAAPYPTLYNVGMMLTGAAGGLGALGLLVAFGKVRRDWLLWGLGGLAGLSLLAASVGLAMAGIFPLPNPLHYGFGLSLAGALTPLLGALALLRLGGAGKAASVLLGAIVLIVALVVLKAGPLAPGGVMMASAAFLCLTMVRRS